MITIRPAKIGDIELMIEIERSSGELFLQVPGLEWIAHDDVQSPQEHRDLIENGLALVAEMRGFGVSGFLNAQDTGDALHVWQIAVRRDNQRRGVGRCLIGAAQSLAKDRGKSALTLTTFRQVPWNEPYYHSLGFETLAYRRLDARLKAILEAERQAGLPQDLRCAMRKTL